MNLADLNNLDVREVGSWPLPARIAVIVLIFALVLGLGYWFDTKKQLAELQTAERREAELKSIFESKAAKAANLEAYEQQLEEMRLSFGAMLRQLPNKTEVADLLVDVSQSGLASGLEFELFKPRAEEPKDFYAELPIDIRVRGDYHEFGNFISTIAALPRIVTLHDIHIAPPSDKEATGLIMELVAKTYRYLDEDETGGGQEKAK